VKHMIGNAVGDRLMGERPSPPRAFAVAFVVGAAVAGATYKMLRSQ
jgi:hypothetical protein